MASRGNPGPLQFFNVLAYQPMTEKTVSYFHSELGYFSIDQDRFFLSNKSKLGTLRLPRDCKHLDIDLNAGFEEWKNLPNVQQHLDSMLYWILFNKESMTAAADFRGVRSDLGLNVDFVTSRGNLARILNVLSGKESKGWTMLATRYRGTVYLSHIEIDNRDEGLSAYGQRVCYWGKRFEVEVTESPCSESSQHETVKRHGPIKAYPGFFSVVRFQLENHTIALRAEVDAQTQFQGEQPSEYVELKVTTETIARAPWAFTRKRLVPWWCQSVVSGTPLIVYGVRDYDGHVKSIEGITTEEIPDRVGQQNLDKEKYLLFLSDMLSWIKNAVCVNEEAAEYMIQWDPNAPRMGVTANLLPRDTENAGFLRDWYVSEMEDYFAHLSKQQQQQQQQQRNPTNRVSRPSIPRGQRGTSGLPIAGHEKRGFWEPIGKGDERAVEEIQRKEQEMKMERINRRFEESWPRRTAPIVKRKSREEEENNMVSNAGEQYIYDNEIPRSRERRAKYRQSRSPCFYDGDHERTALEIEDSRCYSTGESFESGEHNREYAASRKHEDWEESPRTSPLDAGERLGNYQQDSRFRHPSSRYTQLSRRHAVRDETRRNGRRSQKGHDQLQARARSGRKPEDSRPSRFTHRSYSPPSHERLSDSRAKRFKRDAEYDVRRNRHQGSGTRGYHH